MPSRTQRVPRALYRVAATPWKLLPRGAFLLRLLRRVHPTRNNPTLHRFAISYQALGKRPCSVTSAREPLCQSWRPPFEAGVPAKLEAGDSFMLWCSSSRVISDPGHRHFPTCSEFSCIDQLHTISEQSGHQWDILRFGVHVFSHVKMYRGFGNHSSLAPHLLLSGTLSAGLEAREHVRIQRRQAQRLTKSPSKYLVQ